jgi:YVTN family beta-propeller protein
MTIDAPSAALNAPFVHALRVNGKPSQHTWIDIPMHGTTALAFDMSTTANKSWGSSLGDAPPALATTKVALVPATTATVAFDESSIVLTPGETRTITAHVKNGAGVHWFAKTQAGLSLTPTDGDASDVTLTLKPVLAGLYNVELTGTAVNGAKLQQAVMNVRVGRAGEVQPYAWIANRFENTVMPYDLRTHAIGATVAVSEEPRDGVLTPDNSRYFVADRGGKAVSVIDTASMKVIAKIAVGNAPCGTAITPDGSHVWVANYDDGTISAIDTKTLTAGTPITVGKGARYIAISPDNTMLYVSNQGENTVSRVELRTNVVESPLKVGQRPTGIALSPDGKRLYVANNATEDVSVIDTATGKTIASPKAGVEAQMVAISPDGTFAYVPNYSTITVTPIDLKTNTAGKDIRVGGQPFDVQWLRDGSQAIIMVRRDNSLVWIDRDGHLSAPQFLGSGGSYTIAIPR